MDMETILRQFAAVVDRAWWECADARNRELLLQLGVAARYFAGEAAQAKAAEAERNDAA